MASRAPPLPQPTGAIAASDHHQQTPDATRSRAMPLMLPSTSSNGTASSSTASPIPSPGSTPREKRIRVCVRVRPFTKNEAVKAGGKAAWTWHGNSIYQQIFPAQAPSRKPRSVSSISNGSAASSATSTASIDKTGAAPSAGGDNAHLPSSYAFDYLYGPAVHTSQLYDETVRDSIVAAVDGYHSSVFVYGQTGTGKTHTMLGSRSEPGLIQLAVDDIFALIAHHADSQFLLRFSYLEIYNERVYDLLAGGARSEIKIYEVAKQDPTSEDAYVCNDVLIKGLTEEIVVAPDQVLSLVESGNFHRHTASTEANDQSSRSHTIFRLVIESQTATTLRSATLNLIDLAGSESVRLANTTGLHLEEGKYINRSLLTLGHIIWKLSRSRSSKHSDSQQPQQHLPYRNSKLTRILQPALGGKAQITIVATIAPSVECLAETHSTLKFATRARRVKSRLSVNENTGESALLRKYRNRIKVLQSEWEDLEVHKSEGDGRLSREEIVAIDARQRELQFAIENINRVILNSSTRHEDPEQNQREVESGVSDSSNNEEEEEEAEETEEETGEQIEVIEEVEEEEEADEQQQQQQQLEDKEDGPREDSSSSSAKSPQLLRESSSRDSVEPESEGSVRANFSVLSTDSTVSAASSVASRRRGSRTTALKVKYMNELQSLREDDSDPVTTVRAEMLRELVRGLEIAEAEHDTRLSQIRELEVENRHLREQLRERDEQLGKRPQLGIKQL